MLEPFAFEEILQILACPVKVISRNFRVNKYRLGLTVRYNVTVRTLSQMEFN